MKILDKDLVYFLLLNGYSQTNVGLMYGKLGISLSLFETSYLSNNEIAEEYAYDLLREVLASSVTDNSFDNGKAGIAWVILYLINRQYIDADYIELYSSEHDSIVEFLKKKESMDTDQCIDYLFFLLIAEPYIAQKDFEDIWSKLCDIITSSYLEETRIVFDDFYLNSAKIIGLYNIYENKQSLMAPLVETVVQVYCEMLKNDCMRENLAFGVELLAYSMKCMRGDIVILADSIIKMYFSNLLIESIDYKAAVDIIFYIKRLSSLGIEKGEYQLIEHRVNTLLQNKKSHLYNVDRQILSELKRGIPKFVWMRSLAIGDWSFEKHVIML